MNRFSRSFVRRRTAYVALGLPLLALATLALTFGPGTRRLVERLSPDAIFPYALATGVLLSLTILVQWRLYLARRSRDGRRIRREYTLHRWSGLVPVLLLVVHIGGPQATLLSVIGYALVTSSLVGLFNQEVLHLGAGRARALWLLGHVGLAAFMIPLVLVHIWAALAFKVN